MMLSPRTKSAILFVFVFIITMKTYQFFRDTSQRDRLLKFGYLGNCRITEINSSGSKYKNTVCYIYFVNNKSYNDSKQYVISGALESRLLDVTIPILYDKTNPKINHLLLFKSDFQSYNMNYPDSLKWIEELR